MRNLYAAQGFVAIAKAETEMYLSVADLFAQENDKEMCSTILGWAAQAIQDKAALVVGKRIRP